LHGGDKLVYDYEIGGKKYLEGDVYKATSDFTVNRSEGKPWDAMRLAQIVAEVYDEDLTEGEKEALSSTALKSETVLLRKPTNDDGLITVTAKGGDVFEVTAQDYPSGVEGIYWTPSSGKAVNGTETVAEFTFSEGKAEFTTAEFERVEIEYGMTLTNISDDEIKEVLNLPGILAEEANVQIDNLEYLNGAYDELGKLDQKTLNQIQVGVKGSDMGDEAKAAAQAIIDGCVDKENASLYIYQYLTQYRSKGLTYYYQNVNYAKMRNQIDVLIDNFSAIYNDPQFLTLLEDIGYESYYDQIGGLLDDLNSVVLTDPNEAIDTASPSLPELVAALVKVGNAAREFDSASKKLTLNTTLTEAAPERSVLTIKAILKNSADDEISNKFDTLTFSAVEGLNDGDIESINALIDSLVSDLKIDTVHYSTSDTLELKAGDTLVKNETLTFTYTPNQYTVTFKDTAGEKVGEETFFFDVATITLPGCELEGKQYRYTVCGETVITGTEDKSASFTTEQIDGGEYEVITRETLDVEREYTLALIKDLNEGMFNAGMLSGGKLTMAFIPMEDADGNITIVLRVSPDNQDKIRDALQGIAETLTGSSFTHIKLGDELLRDDSVISIQAFIDALLNSGIGIDTVRNAITPDGHIVEMDPIPGVTVIGSESDPETGEEYLTVKSGRINSVDVLGGYLADFDMTLGFSANDEGKKVKLYLTIEDFGENTDSLKDTRGAADSIREKGNITLHDGIADIEVTLTEELHQLYMIAMAALGNADLSDLDEVDLVSAIDLFVDILNYIFSNENITLDTLENTGKKVNIDLDLSAFKGNFEELRYLIKGAIHNITASNEKSVSGTYSADLHYDLSSLLDDYGLSDSLRGIIKESRTGLDAKIQLKVNNTCDYQAIIADTGSDETNIIKFTRDLAADAAGIKNDAVVILLDDVNANVRFNMETVVLDLNGHVINGDLECAKPVIIIDSSVATDSGAGITGSVTGKVTITAGRYDTDVSSLLKGGYTQDETGLVRNGFFFIEDDGEGGTDVHVTPEIDAVNAMDDDSIRNIAMELATDIFFNNYARAAMRIGENGIYSFKIDDVFTLLDGLHAGDLNDLLSGLDCPGITAFINDLLAKLFDFEALGQAIQNGTPVGTYVLEYEPWIFEFDYVAGGDYLTVNLLANDENVKFKNVSIYVDENLGFGKTVSEMGKVITATPSFELSGVKYMGGKLDVRSKISFDVTVNTRDYPDYAIATAVALADATSDADKRSALVEGIKKYYYNGRMAKLKEASANFTTEELFAALYTTKSFPKMLAELGLTGVVDSSVTDLFNTYRSALKAIRAVDEHLADFEGSEKTLGSLETENYGEYYAESTSRTENVSYTANSKLGASITTEIEKVALTVKVFDEEPSYFIIVTDEHGNELYTGDDVNAAFAAAVSGATVEVIEAVSMTEDITVGVDVMVFGSDRIDYGEYSMILDGDDAELTTDTEITDKVKSSSEYSEVTVTGTYVYKLRPLDPLIGDPVARNGEALKGASINTVTKLIIIDVLDPESVTDKMRAGYGVTVDQFDTVIGFEILNAENIDVVFKAKGRTLDASALVPTGAEVTVTATNPDSDVTATATYTVIIIGDVNCNGRVDSGDALQMMNYYFGNISFSEFQLMAADVNRNGVVESGDALKNTVKYNRPRDYKSNLR
ncbi:MAG: dockerin type I repeat-containing protein, partial [Clostridia bacterium]|nr:dockerin type I repeat-containing protein [Clostridia bacterium]